MKKVFSFLFSILFSCGVLLGIFSASNVKAVSTADQSCDLSGGGGVALLGSGVWQTFTPSKNRLTAVKVNLSVEGLVDQQISLSVYHGGTLLVNAGTQTTPPDWVNLTFSFSEKEVTPEDGTYRIVVSASGTSDWVFTASPCYTRGTAYSGGSPMDPATDYGFTTYGYDASSPSPATQDETSTGTSDSPSANTVSNIKTPTSLKAEYVAATNAVKLTWTKSTTTDVDGYKIYRSEEKTKNFKEVGKTAKDIVEFLNDKEVTAGKTYYYIVRAYKASSESVNSNTAEVKIPLPGEAATTSNGTPVSLDTSAISPRDYIDWTQLILLSLLTVLTGTLIIYEIRKKQKTLNN